MPESYFGIGAKECFFSVMQSAWLTGLEQIELREVPKPVPGPDDVVVRVEAALTCGTDLKAYLRGHRLIPMPGPFGHEYSGVVEAVGTNVGAFAPGDAVMGVHSAPCGACYWCRRGEGNLCPHIMETKVLGTYAQYVLIPGHIASVNLFPKPAGLPFVQAALLEPLSCVVHGLRRLTVRPDDTVVIVGPGAIGLLHLAVLKAKGVEKVIVAGRKGFRLERAKRMGADITVDVNTAPLSDVVQDATSGRGADLAIESTGRKDVWEEGPNLVRRGGHVVLFGGLAGGTEVRFQSDRLHYDEITLHSPFHFTPVDVAEARKLLTSGLPGASHLVTDAFSLLETPRVFEYLQTGDCLKCAILPWAESAEEARRAIAS